MEDGCDIGRRYGSAIARDVEVCVGSSLVLEGAGGEDRGTLCKRVGGESGFKVVLRRSGEGALESSGDVDCRRLGVRGRDATVGPVVTVGFVETLLVCLRVVGGVCASGGGSACGVCVLLKGVAVARSGDDESRVDEDWSERARAIAERSASAPLGLRCHTWQVATPRVVVCSGERERVVSSYSVRRSQSTNPRERDGAMGGRIEQTTTKRRGRKRGARCSPGFYLLPDGSTWTIGQKDDFSRERAEEPRIRG